jgi:hypothetical protein
VGVESLRVPYDFDMDYSLALLIAVMVVSLVLAYRKRLWAVGPAPGRPDAAYQRVISAAIVGLLLFVSGLVGWDLSHSHGWFQGTRWVEGPVWWQIVVGGVLLLLAGFWFRRVPTHTTHRS